MKKMERSKVFNWLIVAATFVLTYLILRFTGTYTEILHNPENLISLSVLFEIGVVVYAALLVFLGSYYLYHTWSKQQLKPHYVGAISALMMVTLLLSCLLANWNLYAMPIILVPLVLTFITDKRTAEFMTVLLVLAVLPFAAVAPAVLFMNLFTGILGTVLAAKIDQRREFPVLGIMLAISNLIILFVYHGITGFVLDTFARDAIISAAITFGCVVATIGLLPFFETTAGIVSKFGLLDLANPTNKLLKRLTVEAPGTYYHSIMVGNLAEAAAEKVGANAALARVGAYYHDIGKLKDPLMFMENIHGENPHDKMDPYESVAIITDHTREGVRLGEKYHLPPQVIEIIGQHHGDTQVVWFYNKARKAAEQNGETVDEEDFRYQEDKPASAEAAIIMLADSVEAATKALQDKSVEAIAERIDSVVDGKIADGQLANCPLTMKDISVIKKQFLKSIEGYYHKRDEYPGG